MTDVRPHVLKVLGKYVEDPGPVADEIFAEIAKGTLHFPATQWAVRYGDKGWQLGNYDEHQLALAMQVRLRREGYPDAYLVTRKVTPWEQ